jgi:hypothetical protein
MRLLPLRTGWSPAGPADHFYPADLPEDWRLTYYANEFPAVLLPRDLWLSAAVDDARAWTADTGEGFRFYLEDGGENAGEDSRDRALTLGRALGGRFGGIVAAGSGSGSGEGEIGRVLVSSDDPRDSVGWTSAGIALRVPAEVVGDSRAEAGWIARQTGAAGPPGADREVPGPVVIALLGACSFATLERWLRLSELLGVA